MLIRALTRACGRLTWRPGDVLDLPDGEARELIQTGQVEAVPVPVADSGPDVLPFVAPTPAAAAPKKRKSK